MATGQYRAGSALGVVEEVEGVVESFVEGHGSTSLACPLQGVFRKGSFDQGDALLMFGGFVNLIYEW